MKNYHIVDYRDFEDYDLGNFGRPGVFELSTFPFKANHSSVLSRSRQPAITLNSEGKKVYKSGLINFNSGNMATATFDQRTGLFYHYNPFTIENSTGAMPLPQNKNNIMLFSYTFAIKFFFEYSDGYIDNFPLLSFTFGGSTIPLITTGNLRTSNQAGGPPGGEYSIYFSDPINQLDVIEGNEYVLQFKIALIGGELFMSVYVDEYLFERRQISGTYSMLNFPTTVRFMETKTSTYEISRLATQFVEPNNIHYPLYAELLPAPEEVIPTLNIIEIKKINISEPTVVDTWYTGTSIDQSFKSDSDHVYPTSINSEILVKSTSVESNTLVNKLKYYSSGIIGQTPLLNGIKYGSVSQFNSEFCETLTITPNDSVGLLLTYDKTHREEITNSHKENPKINPIRYTGSVESSSSSITTSNPLIHNTGSFGIIQGTGSVTINESAITDSEQVTVDIDFQILSLPKTNSDNTIIKINTGDAVDVYVTPDSRGFVEIGDQYFPFSVSIGETHKISISGFPSNGGNLLEPIVSLDGIEINPISEQENIDLDYVENQDNYGLTYNILDIVIRD